MKSFFRAIRANILYGVIVLIPVAAFILIAWYIFGIWRSVLAPISDQFGLTTAESRLLAGALALGLLLLICLVIGAVVRTRLGSWTYEKIEATFFKHVPGYDILANLLRGFADDTDAHPPALVRLTPEGAEVVGFIMEDDGASHMIVFVPSAPMMTVGQIYRVPRERVSRIDATNIQVANAISQWGYGLNECLTATERQHGA